MKPETAVVELNLLAWQYVSMFGKKYETRRLIAQCLADNFMVPSAKPNVFMYKGRKILVNFEATADEIKTFKPTFSEVT
jgi:hypothetical protein